jgi:hypothetical protein
VLARQTVASTRAGSIMNSLSKIYVYLLAINVMYSIFYTGSLINNINDITQVHTNECELFNVLLYSVIGRYK